MSNAGVARKAERWQIAAALGSIYLVWGSTYLAIRLSIDTMPPLLMAGVRFLAAGAILYGWSRARGVARPTRIEWRGALIVGALLLLIGNGGVVWSEQLVPSGVVALLVGTVPLWMALIEWLRPGGARPSVAVAVGLLFGFAGVALLISPAQMVGGERINPLGAAIVLGAGICWAFGSLYSRSSVLPSAPLLATGMEMLAGGALLLIVGTVTGEWGTLHLGAVTTRSWIAFAYLIVFGSLVGFTAYIWVLRMTPPAIASTYAYVNPLVAVFLGWAFIGEPFTARTLLAAAVIVAGVVVITTFRARGHLRAATASKPAGDVVAEASVGVQSMTPERVGRITPARAE